MTIEQLVKAVKAHANEHYERGWDVLIECRTDEEIAEHLTEGMTVRQAIIRVAEREYLQVYNDRRNDALAAGELETTEFDLGI